MCRFSIIAVLMVIGCANDVVPAPSPSPKASDGVKCGDVTCAHVCCPSGGATGACADTIDPCLNPTNGHGYAMSCDGPEDCPSASRCCLGLGATASGGTDCETTNCADNPNGATVCHTNADCEAGKTCKHYTFIELTPTLMTCQ